MNDPTDMILLVTPARDGRYRWILGTTSSLETYASAAEARQAGEAEKRRRQKQRMTFAARFETQALQTNYRPKG